MRVAPKKKQLPPPRVRREPPTIVEAIAAAQGLTTDLQEQVEIAAGLMGVTEDEVRPHLPRPTRIPTASIIAGRRSVVVEMRPSRSVPNRTLAARR